MRWLSRAIAVLDRLNAGIVFCAKHLSLTLVACMTVVVLVQVFFRYVVGDALTWTEEVARMMMIWMTFLVAPIAYRSGQNVAIEMLAQMIHGRLRGVLELVLNVLVLGFVVVFFSESLGLVERGHRLKASTVEMQMFWVYLILPISMVLMLLVGVEKLLKDIRVLIDPSYEDTIAPPPITGEVEYE
jgi:TRAP-type C4-dicarboxylate transport system permease small subunit